MKVLSKEQVYEGDRLTTERQGISSTDLMERAGTQIFNWIHLRMQGAQVPIHVFCGIGNNGGDGLVLSRQLLIHGYNVNTYIVNYSDKRSKDFLINYDRIKNASKTWPTVLSDESDLPEIGVDDIIVDAIFGIGINREAASWVVNLFDHLKSSKAFTLAIDIPSGLYTDRAVENPKAVVRANYTLSFQTPKLVFFLEETFNFIGQWEVLDIGIDREYLTTIETAVELIAKNEAIVRYKPREKFSHKGIFGHALIVGGSYGKIGAAILSAKACLVSGAGLVTAFIPKCGYEVFQTSLPEVMVQTDANTSHISSIDLSVKPSSIGIGMGFGQETESIEAFEELLKLVKQPMVIDADAINIISMHPKFLKMVPENSILTPHKKELERLIGEWENEFEMLQRTEKFSAKHKVIVVIKGAHSVTVQGPKKFVNTTGNPGMATAGSGDVLTGIISGLIAQGYQPIDAAIFGVYLHGRAGDIAVENFGYQSLMASDIIDYIGKAYIDLFVVPEEEPSDEGSEENK